MQKKSVERRKEKKRRMEGIMPKVRKRKGLCDFLKTNPKQRTLFYSFSFVTVRKCVIPGEPLLVVRYSWDAFLMFFHVREKKLTGRRKEAEYTI